MISPRTLAALTLVATTVAAAVSGCGAVTVCDLLRCSNNTTITVAGFVPADRFDVVVETDLGSGSFGCVRGDEGFEVVDAEGDFAGSDNALTANCTETGVVLHGATPPSSLTVTIDTGDEQHTGTFADIAYEEVSNGPDCEPACSFTTLELE